MGISNFSNIIDNDEYALETLNATSRYINNAWEVGLLWKQGLGDFPNSRMNALRRLLSLEKKLDQNVSYANIYYRDMDRLIKNGFAKKIDKNRVNDEIWYLPHFGVKNANKPGRVRLVFDAAAKSESMSFNDFLLSGPDLLNSLLGVVMRFRQYSYAIKADMRDMFLKIKIREKDRDAQRFLWKGENRVNEPDEYVMSSMLFGAKSSPCTALYIKNKNADTFSLRYPLAVKGLKNDSYMDDYLASCETVQEAYTRVHQISEISAHADWEMHGWASNSDLVVSSSPIENKNSELFSLEALQIVGDKVLGLKWLNGTDELAFNTQARKF